MSDQERGAYAPPTDEPLTFEARQPVRGARPFPLTLVISVVVLLGLAVAIFVFYRSGVRQSGGQPPAVGALVGDLKSPASADAQPQDPARGLQIYSPDNGQPGQAAGQPQFTPPPEQPQLRAPSPSVVIEPPDPAPKAVSPATGLRPATLAPPPQPAPKASTPEKPKPKLIVVEAAQPEPAAATTAAGGAPVASGAAAVQIGAVSSPALADKTWNEAVATVPGLAAGKGKSVEKVEKDGKVLYRTSVTGFASRADAQAFCAKLKAAGKACFVK